MTIAADALQNLADDRRFAIICGASRWPNLAQFADSDAFLNSAIAMREYLESPQGMRVPAVNSLWLFDEINATDQYDQISGFLRDGLARIGQPNGLGVLIMFFYVGHGAFFTKAEDYCLLVKDTRNPLPDETSLKVTSLSRLLKNTAPQSSRLFILDCCFAGAAAGRVFQSSVEQLAQMRARQQAILDRSIALLCAASSRNTAKVAPSGEKTSFTRALMHALEKGDPKSGQQEFLTLYEVCELTKIALDDLDDDEASRPEVHSPDQELLDLAHQQLFPNEAFTSAPAPALPPPPLLLSATAVRTPISNMDQVSTPKGLRAWLPWGLKRSQMEYYSSAITKYQMAIENLPVIIAALAESKGDPSTAVLMIVNSVAGLIGHAGRIRVFYYELLGGPPIRLVPICSAGRIGIGGSKELDNSTELGARVLDVLMDNKLLLIHNAALYDSDYGSEDSVRDIASMVTMPVSTRDVLFGALTADSPAVNDFTAGDIGIMNTLASLLAAAMDARRGGDAQPSNRDS